MVLIGQGCIIDFFIGNRPSFKMNKNIKVCRVIRHSGLLLGIGNFMDPHGCE